MTECLGKKRENFVFQKQLKLQKKNLTLATVYDKIFVLTLPFRSTMGKASVIIFGLGYDR